MGDSSSLTLLSLRDTPNLVCAEDLFAEIATAVHPSDSAEADRYKEMLFKTAVRISEWPLQVKSRLKMDDGTPIDKESILDCPEYMIYVQYTTGEWELYKTENLKTAQKNIVKQGYNLQKTSSMIVLHNLEAVPYTLFKETDEGLVMVTPEEARGQKKLYLNWKK